ncbi:MAG TPA: ABC transporter ATP-binding protein [Candidatus Bathyarchaeia archaeon]|nr:ABC transporter ATP-binding protein [Candidatus Bathyarchaeia archaeon]
MTKKTIKNTTNTIIECINLSKIYPFGSERIHALKDVNLTIEKGEFTAIMGKSGSGKTTLINILAGLASPTSGEVLIDGEDITTMSSDQLSLLRREKIGIVFQMFNLHPGLTVLENVELPLVFSGYKKEVRKELAKNLLFSLELKDFIDNYPEELSGGEQQRVAIARSLINTPQILLADEPTGNLNSLLAQEVVKQLKDLNQQRNLTIVFVTHNETLIDDSMTLIRLSDGQISQNK